MATATGKALSLRKLSDWAESPFMSSMICLKKKGTSMFKSLASRRSDKAIMTRIFTDQLSLGQMYLNKVFKILISDMSNFFDDVDCSLNMVLL